MSRPRVSVVVEGYNESLSLGSVAATMQGLRNQDFPLGDVEVILVGSGAQAEDWERTYSCAAPFFAVKTVSASGAHYYALKNEGVRMATADIIALTDSDVRLEPGWLSSIVTGVTEGADVCCGITLFSSEDGRGSNHALMQVAASISWGFVVRRALDDKTAVPAGFLSHNVGFRTSVFRRHQYRTDLGRTCAGSFLYEALCDAGARIVLQPHQRVAHNFSLRWWVFRLHRRFGYEVFLLRRLKPAAKWLPLFKPVEPLLTMMWHVTLDIPQWLRFSRLLRVPRWRRLALLPAVVGMSVLARAGEMIGMYETIVMPAAMKRFAESN